MYRLPFKSSLGPPAEAGAQREKPAPHSINRFAAGAVVSGLCDSVHADEISEKGRERFAATT